MQGVKLPRAGRRRHDCEPIDACGRGGAHQRRGRGLNRGGHPHLRSDHIGRVKCWGDNSGGQLGDGTKTNRTTPVDVVTLTSGVADVAAGTAHTCALTTAGGVKCWGRNEAGQLGDGTTTNRLTPVDVSGLSSGVAALSADAFHTCALTTAGGLKCWGSNNRGQLGDGTTTNRSTPVDVVGLSSGAAAVSAGGVHTCALTTAGGGKCWGGNEFGQLGDETTTNRTTPVGVVGLASGVAAVSAGSSHTCALTTAGGVKCWGSSLVGQLGDGSAGFRTAPVDVVGFAPPAPPARISLDPLAATNDIGTDHTVTATIVDSAGVPLVGDLVTFAVISGPNPGVSGTCSANADCTSDANGEVSFTYTSNGNPGTDVIEAGFTNGTGVLRSTTADKTWVVVAGDTRPPRCEVIGVNPAPPATLTVEVEDPDSGVLSFEVLTLVNATVEIPAGSGQFFNQGPVPNFASPVTSTIPIEGVKIDQTSNSTLKIRVTDASGNVPECDPVLVSLSSEAGSRVARQTLTSLPYEERYLTLYGSDLGLAFVLVNANGRWFTLLGDARKATTIDVGSAMVDGVDNTITLRVWGAGTVMVSDVVPARDSKSQTSLRGQQWSTLGFWNSAWRVY